MKSLIHIFVVLYCSVGLLMGAPASPEPKSDPQEQSSESHEATSCFEAINETPTNHQKELDSSDKKEKLYGPLSIETLNQARPTGIHFFADARWEYIELQNKVLFNLHQIM